MFKSLVLILVIALASVAAFTAPAASRPARMSMMFKFGGGGSSNKNYQVNQGTANKGTYIPDGLTKEQYAKFLQAEEEKKNKKKAKFPKGKEPETLTEWMVKEAKKGNVGKGLLLKGHRMVKTKYEGWYTDESPV